MSAPSDLLTEVERIAGLGTWVWSRGGVSYWSDEFQRILGYAPGSVTPSYDAFYAVVHPEDRARVWAAWQREHSEGYMDPVEYRVVDQATGCVRHVRGSGRVYFRDGEPSHIVGALQDVTEARRSAIALEEASAIARVAEQVARFGSFVVQTEPLKIAWTDGLKALTGLYDDDADTATRLAIAHPEDREEQLAWWRRVLDGHATEPLSWRLLKPDGSVRHIYTQAAKVLIDGEQRVVGTSIDVTERVQLEDQLRHAAKMEAIGTLASGVAHDFNNYLMVMDSCLSMLSDSSDAVERVELVQAGRLALNRSMDLTRQLLTFARRQPFSPTAVDLRQVLTRFQDLLSSAIGRRAALRMDPGQRSLSAWVDPRHVERILTNLVVNAADAIEASGRAPGEIRVTLEPVTLTVALRAEPRDVPAGNYVCVSVEDDGGGIPPERLSRIFDPYFTTKRQGRGSGLGLSLVYGMARQNGGVVTVSTVSRGTRFTLWFTHLTTDPVALAPPGPAPKGTPDPAPQPRVLVVEDIDQVRVIAARILRTAGYRVLAASHGAEALATLDREPDVQLVLTDVQMPVMGGRELARELKRRGNGPPVVFMTGYSEDTHGAAHDPSFMVLAKPFTPERLVEFVGRALKTLAVASPAPS